MRRAEKTNAPSGKRIEQIRTKTIGSDFDIEHQELFWEICETLGVDGSTLIRKVFYPLLDRYKEQRSLVMKPKIITFYQSFLGNYDYLNGTGGVRDE